MGFRVALAMLVAPLVVPAYAWSVSGSAGSLLHVLLLGLVAQALAFVSGYFVAVFGWKPSAVMATVLGATVGAMVSLGLALVWQASEMLQGVPVLAALGAVVGFLYWAIAWWSPNQS
jgi:hypothetical protein